MSVINLRQYTQSHNLRFSDALKEATDLLKIYNESGDCCPLRTMIVEMEKPYGAPEARMRSLNDVIQAIMFSSGFYCVIKSKNKKFFTVMVRAMTEEEKTRCGYIAAPPSEDVSDPV